MLDKKYLEDLQLRKIGSVKLVFIKGGCSGTKIDVVEDFVLSDDIVCIDTQMGCSIYVEVEDKDKWAGARVTRTLSSDHTGKVKTRFIFSNSMVKDRCGCGTSFSFEKKVPKFNLEKFKQLKKIGK